MLVGKISRRSEREDRIHGCRGREIGEGKRRQMEGREGERRY